MKGDGGGGGNNEMDAAGGGGGGRRTISRQGSFDHLGFRPPFHMLAAFYYY